MSQELLYTSSQKGLDPTKRGFCTVLATAGMPSNLSGQLERLSAYKHHFPAGSEEASQNPVALSHVTTRINGRLTSILSRVSDYKLDYSGRSNKLAHHIVLDSSECCDAGPAWLLKQPGLMRTDWNGECANVPVGPNIPEGQQRPAVCKTWEHVTGDAGHAGQIAEAVQQSSKPIWVIYSLSQMALLLDLLNEVVALLPPEQRWDATFSTFFGQDSPDISCKIRCVVENSDLARMARSKGIVFSLVNPSPITTPSSMVLLARGSKTPSTVEPPKNESEVISPIRDRTFVSTKDQAPPPLPSKTSQIDSETTEDTIPTAALVSSEYTQALPPRLPPAPQDSSPAASWKPILLTAICTALIVTMIFGAFLLGRGSRSASQEGPLAQNTESESEESLVDELVIEPEPDETETADLENERAAPMEEEAADGPSNPSPGNNEENAESELTIGDTADGDVDPGPEAPANAGSKTPLPSQEPPTQQENAVEDATASLEDQDMAEAYREESIPDSENEEVLDAPATTSQETGETLDTVPAISEGKNTELRFSLDDLIWLNPTAQPKLNIKGFKFAVSTYCDLSRIEYKASNLAVYHFNPHFADAVETGNKFNPIVRRGGKELQTAKGKFDSFGLTTEANFCFYEKPTKLTVGEVPRKSDRWNIHLCMSEVGKETAFIVVAQCNTGDLSSQFLPKQINDYAEDIFNINKEIHSAKRSHGNQLLDGSQEWVRALDNFILETDSDFPKHTWEKYLLYFDSQRKKDLELINAYEKNPIRKSQKLAERKAWWKNMETETSDTLDNLKITVEKARDLRTKILKSNRDSPPSYAPTYLSFKLYKLNSFLTELTTIDLGQAKIVLLENEEKP